MKRINAFIFALLIVLAGVCFGEAAGNVAYAEETAYIASTGEFISEKLTVTKGKVPDSSTAGYEDWLFAGWYSDKACARANVIKKANIDNVTEAWAKFVPSEVLTVKVQVSEGTQSSDKTNMRFVSSIDTLNYAGIGLRVEYHSGTDVVVKTFAGTKVFSKIIASDESGVDYEYNPKVFDTKSAWFITGTVTNIPSDKYQGNFVVKPYWVTFDGTYVYGESRYVQVQDAYSDNVNIPVKADSQSTIDSLTITGETISERRYYEGETYGSLMVEKSRSTLSSLTAYEVTQGGTIVKSATYRNLESALGESIENVPTGDRSWYETIAGEKEFVVVTPADLYGLAELVNNNTENFDNKTIFLGANITVNEIAEKYSDNWKTYLSQDTSVYQWKPIGAEYAFSGTLDGYKSTIYGISAKSDETYLGLFGKIGEDSVVKNVRLENSNFEQTGSGYVGSIVSDCAGVLDNVYSNAMVSTTYQQAGGIIGRANGNSSCKVTNAWYDGTIELQGDALYGGGIIGVVVQGEWTLSNCLFTGNITSEYVGNAYVYVGGICGSVENPATDQVTGLKMDSCVSTGTIRTSNSDLGAGALVGRVRDGASALTMTNVFASREAGYTGVGASDVTVTGQAVWTNHSDRLIGYCKEDTTSDYKGATLTFDSDWIIRDEGTPVPTCFADKVTQVKTADIDKTIGLDKWTSFDSNASIANAMHYGDGKYVLRFGSSSNPSKNTYLAYITHLTTSEVDGGLGFEEYACNENLESDKVYSTIYTKQSGDWVLNVLHTENTGVTTITIRTGVKELLSPNLKEANVTSQGSDNVTLSMLTLTGTVATSGSSNLYYYGNSYVFQLPNSHFIVNDGGNLGDYDGLIEYLKILAGKDDEGKQNPVRIDAWTVTHQHGDHFGAVRGFCGNLNANSDVTVEAFYVNEPNNRAYDFICKDDGSYKKVSLEAEIQYRGVRAVKTMDGRRTPVYSYQTGERYYFNGLTMDVIQSQEQLLVGNYGKVNAYSSTGTDFNTTSTVLLFTTTDNQKTLIGGDANYVNMEYIMNAYGEGSSTLAEIDVFQVWHHGKNMSYSVDLYTSKDRDQFLKYLTANGHKFSVALFPCSLLYGIEYEDNLVFPYAKDRNQYIIDNCIATADAYYTYGDDTSKVVRVEFIGEGITHGRYDIVPVEDSDESGTGTIVPGNPDQNIPGGWN